MYCGKQVWHIRETYGIPLDLIIGYMYEHGHYPITWYYLYLSMVSSGMDPYRAVAGIQEAVTLACVPDAGKIIELVQLLPKYHYIQLTKGTANT
jgi:hypothetical protein